VTQRLTQALREHSKPGEGDAVAGRSPCNDCVSFLGQRRSREGQIKLTQSHVIFLDQEGVTQWPGGADLAHAVTAQCQRSSVSSVARAEGAMQI